MSQERDNITSLIQGVKTLSVADKAIAGTVALINLIPFAGGAVASVISEYANQRKSEKVCEVLSDLNSKLESHKTNPESHLSKDQIIEVVHETLQTVVTASDERKISALKNGLGYAFLADDSFERKQLLLQILRNCTSMELAALATLYDASDPYIVREGGPESDLYPTYKGVAVAPTYATLMPQGNWKPAGNRDDCGKPPLLKFLTDQLRFDERDVDGALRLLDGKGLANASPNLRRTDCQVFKWVSYPGGMYNVAPVSANGMIMLHREIRDTPLEASRTDFGRGFLAFCRHT